MIQEIGSCRAFLNCGGRGLCGGACFMLDRLCAGTSNTTEAGYEKVL